MYRSENCFATLAARARTGDMAAPAELRRQLEPAMIRVVRRVVQDGAGTSSVDRRILAEARRVGLDAKSATSAEGERLIRAVAFTVSALFVDGLRARPMDRAAAKETVCT